jgi:hypothetical protein
VKRRSILNIGGWKKPLLAASLSAVALLVGVAAFGLMPGSASAEQAQDGPARNHYVVFIDADD